MKHSLAAVMAVVVAGVVLVDCGGDEAGSGPSIVGLDSGAEADNDAAEPPPPETEGSGSRFRTTHALQKWGDGTEVRSFGGFFDRELLEPCTIRHAGGDAWACLPDFLDRAEEGFSDASCSTPALALSTTTASSTRWAAWGPRCSPHFGSVAASALTEGALYRRDSTNQQCISYRSKAGIMPVPNEVPASTFGAFTRKVESAPFPGEKSGTRLTLESVRFDGADGSFEWRAPRIIDLARKSTGEIGLATDGTIRFFTAYGTVSQSDMSFSDSACTKNGVISFPHDGSCGDPMRPRDGFKSYAGSDCIGPRPVSRPAIVPLEKSYELAGTCRERASYASIAPDERGAYEQQPLADVPLADLVALTKSTVPAARNVVPGTRLDARAIVHTSGDGLSLRSRTPVLWLKEADLACDAFQVKITGSCQPDVPVGFASPDLFADDACTEELTPIAAYCGMPAKVYLTAGDKAGTLAIRPIPEGALIRPSVVYRSTTGPCVAEAPVADYAYVIRRLAFAAPAIWKGVLPKITKHDVIVD